MKTIHKHKPHGANVQLTDIVNDLKRTFCNEFGHQEKGIAFGIRVAWNMTNSEGTYEGQLKPIGTSRGRGIGDQQ